MASEEGIDGHVSHYLHIPNEMINRVRRLIFEWAMTLNEDKPYCEPRLDCCGLDEVLLRSYGMEWDSRSMNFLIVYNSPL